MKRDRHLPAGMYSKHGAYYLVRRNKWTRLADSLPDALLKYSRAINPTAGAMPRLLDDFLLDCRERAKPVALNTVKQYESAAKVLKEAFNEFNPGDLRPTHVAQLLDHHKKTPNMANRMRTVLKLAMDRAVRHGSADSNPVTSIPRFEEGSRERYITDSEFNRILAVAPPIVRAMMKLQFLTGQRFSDVLNIKHSDITDAGIEFQQEKTGKRLIVAMTPQLHAAIAEARQLRSVRGFYLVAQRNGKPYSYKGMADGFKRAAEKAGVVDARPNDLRAKSGTDADEQGINPTKLLGHDDARTTKTYLRNRKAKVVNGPALAADS